ncbi:MAG TPA: hypothetical protein VN282_17170 [Pyrinomonadaceae bacterium]|nr:hypothetical protein [Pyrinomonadaceae bacterium]
MVAKRSRWPLTDAESRVPDLKSPDEEARGTAVRAFCPCHAGWEAFEAHVGEVLRAMRDPSRAVRAEALHVFEDAAKMQRAADLAYCEGEGEERIGEKRAQRFRSLAERLEARRDKRARRRKRRRGRA